MRWNKKEKKPKEVKLEPQLGGFKRKVRFAFFPVKIEDKIVWWEKYIKVWRYEKRYHTEEYTVSSGLLEDAFTTTGLLNERTVTEISAYKTWCYYGREFYVA